MILYDFICLYLAGEILHLCLTKPPSYLLTASLDKSWAIHDFATGRCLRHMKAPDVAVNPGNTSPAVELKWLLPAVAEATCDSLGGMGGTPLTRVYSC